MFPRKRTQITFGEGCRGREFEDLFLVRPDAAMLSPSGIVQACHSLCNNPWRRKTTEIGDLPVYPPRILDIVGCVVCNGARLHASQPRYMTSKQAASGRLSEKPGAVVCINDFEMNAYRKSGRARRHPRAEAQSVNAVS